MWFSVSSLDSTDYIKPLIIFQQSSHILSIFCHIMWGSYAKIHALEQHQLKTVRYSIMIFFRLSAHLLEHWGHRSIMLANEERWPLLKRCSITVSYMMYAWCLNWWIDPRAGMLISYENKIVRCKQAYHAHALMMWKRQYSYSWRERHYTWKKVVNHMLLRWRHDIETLSALPDICNWNHRSLVYSPHRMPVMRNFDVFFVDNLDRLFKKESKCRIRPLRNENHNICKKSTLLLWCWYRCYMKPICLSK